LEILEPVKIIITGNSSKSDIFVSKLGMDGNQEFFKLAGGDGGDFNPRISAVGDCVYVTGRVDGNFPIFDFNGNLVTKGPSGSGGPTGNSNSDIFVSKLK